MQIYFKQLFFKWSGRKIRIMKKVIIQINFTGILSRFFTDFSWILNEFKRILPLLCNNTCVFLSTPKPCYIKIREKSAKNLLKIPVKFVWMMTFFMILIIIFLSLDLKKKFKSQKITGENIQPCPFWIWKCSTGPARNKATQNDWIHQGMWVGISNQPK